MFFLANTTDQDDKISSSKDQKLVCSSSSWIKDLDIIISKPLIKGSVASSLVPPASSGHRDMHHISFLANPNHNATNHLPFMEIHESLRSSSSELHLEEEDLDIPWSELRLKGKIGAGIFFHRFSFSHFKVKWYSELPSFIKWMLTKSVSQVHLGLFTLLTGVAL